ncbi:MAG: sigma-54-dependent Fis family transcriptional regulator [bacterium]|nr:sigma-54-dependent Fis family transcriptional regulator [bacterium]
MTEDAARILVVEDNEALRSAVVTALSAEGHAVSECGDGQVALEIVGDRDRPPFDVVVCDLRLPGVDGASVQRAVRQRDPRTAFILMTAFVTVEVAVDAMREGAFDFIQKPFELTELELRVQRALEQVRLREEVQKLRTNQVGAPRDLVVARSASMREAVVTAERVAGIRSTVLLTGETGTGKEVIAGLIHAHSARASGPFVKVNCAALPETLLESELFGHEAGAYTGADRRRIGHFEQASGGTLLLDEIVETSPATQAKLLRVLQDQEFYRLGGTRAQKTRARIIAATNRDLRQALADGSLREDLYYRINVIAIHLEPLRERREDIVPLAEHYLERFARDLGRPCSGLSSGARERLVAYPWPGNVRELCNAIERAVLLCEGTQVAASDIQLRSPDAVGSDGEWRFELPAGGLSLQTVERGLVMAALRRANFVQKDAAQLIGVSKRKLNYMIQRMGVVHPTWRRNRDTEDADSATDTETNK